MMPRVTGSEPRIVLYRDNYDVLIDPKQLVDISLDEGTQLAVTLEKVGVLAERGNPNARFVQSLISDPRAGTNRDYVYAAARRGEWTAIAIQNIDQIDPEYTRLKEALIPIGALISLLFIGASIWIIRWCNSLKADLILAVWRKEFTIHYQPLIDIRNGACVGAEALIRWRRRDGSFVSPDTFIPLAEQSSLIFSITDQVIASVVREMAPTLSAERSLHISINLSASDVSTGRVLDVLERELSGTGIRSEQIWLEATERGFVKIDDARDVILRAHQHGYSIVMDDFGTGYSSLQYLESLPLDALKIDKSFVNTIGKAMAKSSVTPHIIEMARTLNLACIAEGVETDQQLKYLAEQGVQFAQGWLFSKPLPAAEFLAFFARRKAEFGSGPEATDSGSGDLTLIASPPTSQAAS
jgi:sensor c-di-GMP phosphodiesterase-like protein